MEAFTECAACAAKPGSPTLCQACSDRWHELHAMQNPRERINAKRRQTVEDIKLGSWMSAALDDPTVCQEMKLDIIAWMDSFEYRKFTAMECMLIHAEKLNW